MKNEDLITLEKLVDHYGLHYVLDQLVYICYLKADHIMESYNDKGLAELWETDGKRLGKVKVLNGACRNGKIISDTGWIKP
jgi:hypothetical protein